MPDQCDVKTAGELEDNEENVIGPRWFMQITAMQSFAFEHGNEIVPVERGQDNATHLNLLTNHEVVPNITPTRETNP